MSTPTSIPTPLARALDAAIEATVIASFSRFGPAARSRLFAWRDAPPGALDGRVALVTGATSGIGGSLARSLAALGAEVHVVGRDAERLEQAVSEIRAASPRGTVVGEHADLSVLDDVRALAARLTGASPRLDVLAHVAGNLQHRRELTADGIEVTLQTHVVAPFLLTSLLVPLLAASGDARVLTMSSGGMYTERLDVDNLVRPVDPFDGTVTYARAKRAQVELNAAWADHHADLGIGFHAMHPGWVDTPGLRSGLPGFAKWLAPVLRDVEQGADTACWLSWTADAPAPGGRFWLDRVPRHTVILPWTRTPAGERERLWQTVSALAGVGDDSGVDAPIFRAEAGGTS